MASEDQYSQLSISQLKKQAEAGTNVEGFQIRTWLTGVQNLLNKAKNAREKQHLKTLYLTNIQIASIVLEVVPNHNDFKTIAGQDYNDYLELKQKVADVLGETENIAKILETQNFDDKAAPTDRTSSQISMPVPHPVMLSEQIQPVFGISDTSGSSSANGGITLKPSPVYIVGQQAIGNITSNPTNGDSQTIASLPPTIASRIASLNQAGMVDQAKVPPITLNNKNINSTKSLDSVSKPAITTSIHVPGSMQMPEPPSSSFETKRDPLADFPITNTIKPSELLHWLRVEKNPPKILVLDVRNRDQFKNGHIKTQNIVCLEPIILQDQISSIDLESKRLILSPEKEKNLFSDRKAFDLIVYHDQDSVHNPGITSNNTNPRPSSASTNQIKPLYNLVQAIWLNEFTKPPRRPPVLLIGGFEGWKRLGGEAEIEKEQAEENNATNTNSNGVREPLPQHDKTKRNGIVIADNRDFVEAFGESTNRNYATNVLDLFLQPTGPSTVQSMTFANYPHPSSNNVQQYNNYYSSPQSAQLPESLIAQQTQAAPTPTVCDDVGSSTQAAPLSNVDASGSTSLRRRRTFIDHPFNSFTKVNNPDYSAPPRPRRLPPPPPPKKPLPEPNIHSNINTQTEYSSMAPITSIPSNVTESEDLSRRSYHQRFPASESSFSQLGSGIGTTGLKNLGNTCFMNSVIQCLSGTVPFSRYFLNGSYRRHINLVNPLGTQGKLAEAFGKLIRVIWSEQYTFVSPVTFKEAIGRYAPQFSGSDQQDSQEFLAFLLDGLHEDLNIPKYKPPIKELTEREEEERERLQPQIVSEMEWENYTLRNWSIVVSLFQGQLRSRLQCLTCQKTSTTYNTFMYLSLPIPTKTSNYSPIDLYLCLNEFVKEEIMDGEDAWFCSRCQVHRRATKTLTLSRLPDILLIHLKRFSFNGPFRDKLETMVECPLRSLDLSNYMLPPLPPTVASGLKLQQGNQNELSTPHKMQTTQRGPPYLYDLYAVSNHYGGLNGGHYTACVRNGYRQEWHYFDDSRVSVCDERNVMTRAAYSLFYVRTSIP